MASAPSVLQRAAAALLLVATTSSAQQPVSVTVNVDLNGNPLNPNVNPTYLAVNIDTGSLYNNLDLTNPTLINLMNQLGNIYSNNNPPYPATGKLLRVGGGAADNTLFTGARGASGAGGDAPWNNTVVYNSSYWDQLVSFAQKSNSGLVFNLNGLLRNSTGQWDPTINATALFDHIASTPGQASQIYGWQLGNEPTLWGKHGVKVSGAQLAADYATLRQVLKRYPSLPQTIIGPEGCCGDNTWLQDFLPGVAATKSLDYFSQHYYPITPNGPACTVEDYLNISYYNRTIGIMDGYKALRDTYAPGIPLVLGETATTNMGGCPTLSASFASGFYFTYILGAAAAAGVDQVNRQDLVGYSSQTEPSQYMLAGQPGWTGGPLSPHPDWFTAVLFNQLVAFAALSVDVTFTTTSSSTASTTASSSSSSSSGSAADYSGNLAVHSFCAQPQDSAEKGAVMLSYVNTGGESVQMNLNPSLMQSGRTSWILTSQATPNATSTSSSSGSSGSGSSAGPMDPPSSLTSDSIYLNGQLLTVGPDGMLPQRPVPGHSIPQPGPNDTIVVPPYSYGFFYFGDVGAGACPQ